MRLFGSHLRFLPFSARLWRVALPVAVALLVAACAAPMGDFGRPQASFVNDTALPWAGDRVAHLRGEPSSRFPFTDDERELRDRAHALVAPVRVDPRPLTRDAFEALLSQWRETRLVPNDRFEEPAASYADRLLTLPHRSHIARYMKLVDDIAADMALIEPFFAVAQRVGGMDAARERAIGGFARAALPPTGQQISDATARIAENRMLVGWVHRRIGDRIASYRHALERLVIATPDPAAATAERALAELERRVAALPALVPQAPVAVLPGAGGGAGHDPSVVK